MKKLFLSLVLLLTVSFAFATNDVEKVSTVDITTVDITTVELTNFVELENADFTKENDVTYTVSSEEDASCGFTLTISDGNFSWTTEIDCSGWDDNTWDGFIQDILDWLAE
ncbi:MAG: hypothetical protein GKR88_07680 [Flavobacteriaceae bacterium]|nr:MAG: hypothetical protein GKR88_07680 [Flavobacteriaceae bacterium]